MTILSSLADIVGQTNVLTGDDVVSRTVGWFDNSPRCAKAIVRPKSTKEVSKVMALCHQNQISIVTLGGATGFVDGATSQEDQIVLSMERMTDIESIDVDNRSIIVQAGVPLQKLHEFAQEHDLHYPVDLGSRGSCTLGGMASTNAGGNEVLRYGMSREQILGLEVVLADGQVVSNLRALLKNNTGYDLKQLFIGSEGTLGIVTKLALRLRPLHSSLSTALVAVDSFKKVVTLLRTLDRNLGGRLSAYEVMWQDHFKFVIDDEQKHKAPLPLDHAFYVLVQAANYHELEAEIFMSSLEQCMENKLIADAAIASSKAQQQALWAIRDDIECLTVGLAPYIGYDVSLPINAMESYIESLKGNIKKKWADAKVIVFGHLGDGNLHLFIHIGPTLSAADKAEVNRLVYAPLKFVDGSISAEHGIGLQKKAYLKYSRTAAEVDLMRQLKNMLDPNKTLNPGIIFD
ncbi:FAD-binding oxidoreductase [Reinekea sp.]|jgi:FAD/FMN-containing dehydrogenase|uniref:FAD-binding oxidoreductase n=1 Tax=Reinekea sp. TaxID=1970455 RepID=UPI0039899EEB